MDAMRVAGDLAATPFASRDEATAAVLDLIGRMTGLRTPFLARTEQGTAGSPLRPPPSPLARSAA